jgi:hypothetical protein
MTQVKRPKQPVYQQIASLLVAIDNCRRSGNAEWLAKHEQRLRNIVAERMPRGSGFDHSTHLWNDDSTPDKLVFGTSFHHMNDVGMYDGWTDHTITMMPSLAFGFVLKISGSDRNDIKDYIAEVFNAALSEEVEI